jgi:hypothetical protein
VTDATISQHVIAGQTLTMPVHIGKATQHMAMFSVDADAAQRMIDYSGLKVCRYRPNKAVVALILAHFIDGDLSGYHEHSTGVMVNPPGSEASGFRALQSAGTFIHHMLVDQEFTLEAGRTIWGYPKVMADFTMREGRHFGYDLNADGQFALSMDLRRGLPVPTASRPQVQRSFSCLDGILRDTPFEMTLSGPRFRPGGATVRLGDHPYARELASLGFPKRAMISSSTTNVEMTFGDAKEIA